jgi:hypothetical protein
VPTGAINKGQLTALVKAMGTATSSLCPFQNFPVVSQGAVPIGEGISSSFYEARAENGDLVAVKELRQELPFDAFLEQAERFAAKLLAMPGGFHCWELVAMGRRQECFQIRAAMPRLSPESLELKAAYETQVRELEASYEARRWQVKALLQALVQAQARELKLAADEEQQQQLKANTTVAARDDSPPPYSSSGASSSSYPNLEQLLEALGHTVRELMWWKDPGGRRVMQMPPLR